MKQMIELNAGTIVQRSEVNRLTSEGLTALMATLAASGKPVRVVDSTTNFFRDDSLFEAINRGDLSTVELIAERRGLVLTIADLTQITSFNQFKERLAAQLVASKPAYDFAELPEGWTLEDNIVITAKGVYRKGNSSYRVGEKTLERIWKAASKHWADDRESPRISDIQAAGYNRNGIIRDNEIEIGCQTIHRYEIEQVALHFAWEFPK